jgi:hypothetical protein
MRFRLFGRSGGLNEGGQNELSISPNGEAIVRGRVPELGRDSDSV